MSYYIGSDVLETTFDFFTKVANDTSLINVEVGHLLNSRPFRKMHLYIFLKNIFTY